MLKEMKEMANLYLRWAQTHATPTLAQATMPRHSNANSTGTTTTTTTTTVSGNQICFSQNVHVPAVDMSAFAEAMRGKKSDLKKKN